MIRALFQLMGLIGIVVVVIALSSDVLTTSFEATNTRTEKLPRPEELTAATSEAVSEPEVPVPEPAEESLPEPKETPTPELSAPSQKTAQNNEIHRVAAYAYPPLSADALNTLTRGALVNILCTTSSSMVRPISGSGVIIDPRGVVLTNAHVAQYVLLGSRPEVDLDCAIRTGSPAQARWKADILYFPKEWLDEHAADLTKSRPMGTGERDYALLLITESVTAEPLPTSFPFLPADTRGSIMTVDGVFLAAYPAEFSGGNTTRGFFSASSAIGVIQQLLTFNENTVDLYSLGSTVLAQSGSSGGAVVNAWGHLIGIITTTSDGETTAERELHALTLSYINRDFLNSTTENLGEFLSHDVREQAIQFMKTKAPLLSQKLIDELESR